MKEYGWFIQGVNLNNKGLGEKIVLHPETLTTEEILSEDNVEVRRIMLERYGWHNFLTKVDAEVIDRRDNDIDFTKEVLFKFSHNDELHKILVATCKTGRIFSMEVPAETETAEEGSKYLAANDVTQNLLPPMNSIGRT